MDTKGKQKQTYRPKKAGNSESNNPAKKAKKAQQGSGGGSTVKEIPQLAGKSVQQTLKELAGLRSKDADGVVAHLKAQG